jgi:hypothetical protein
MLLNGIRQAPVETSADSGFVLAKLRDHGLLTLLHNEEARAHPDQQQSTQNDAHTQISENWWYAVRRGTVRWALVIGPSVFTAQELRQFAIQIAP